MPACSLLLTLCNVGFDSIGTGLAVLEPRSKLGEVSLLVGEKCTRTGAIGEVNAGDEAERGGICIGDGRGFGGTNVGGNCGVVATGVIEILCCEKGEGDGSVGLKFAVIVVVEGAEFVIVTTDWRGEVTLPRLFACGEMRGDEDTACTALLERGATFGEIAFFDVVSFKPFSQATLSSSRKYSRPGAETIRTNLESINHTGHLTKLC